MTAEVVIPAGCSAPEKEEQRVDDSYLDHFDQGAAMGYTTSLELPQFGEVSIEYKDSANPNVGTIMSGKNEVGKYFASKTGNMYNITTGGPGDHPYSIKDDGNPYLYLEYFSSNIFRHGWTQGNYYVNEPANRYRMVLADLSTGSTYEASRVGLIVETKKGGTPLTSESKEIGEAGYAVGNVDATVICERPRIRPHVEAIRARLAALLDVPVSSISVKGKTNEGMDAVGAGMGIAVHAVALLVSGED